MEPEKVVAPTDAELKEEEEAQREAKEEEVRAAVITEYGFDEDSDAEKIDKLTKERLTFKQEKGSLTKQKIKYRDLAQKGGVKPPEANEQKTTLDPAALDQALDAKLEQRDLDAMEYPDAIKEEIKRVAQIQKVSIKQAVRDPYIVTRIEEHEKAVKAEEATISRKANKAGGRKNWSTDTPPDVDMSTQEGRDTYEDWKQWAVGQGA